MTLKQRRQGWRLALVGGTVRPKNAFAQRLIIGISMIPGTCPDTS
jgi:hypothetical protein